MSDWRPIETAPRDGARVLVWSGAYRGTAFIARLDDDRYAKRPRPFWEFEGQDTTTARAHQPTHWMPLPAPPSPSEQGVMGAIGCSYCNADVDGGCTSTFHASQCLAEQLEEAQGKIEGLLSDLDSALNVIVRRVNGEADLASAKEWLGLNYPGKFRQASPGEPVPKVRRRAALSPSQET